MCVETFISRQHKCICIYNTVIYVHINYICMYIICIMMYIQILYVYMQGVNKHYIWTLQVFLTPPWLDYFPTISTHPHHAAPSTPASEPTLPAWRSGCPGGGLPSGAPALEGGGIQMASQQWCSIRGTQPWMVAHGCQPATRAAPPRFRSAPQQTCAVCLS